MNPARSLCDAGWLKSGPAVRVLALLSGNGEEARIVGGAVRNALMGLPVGEIDVATTALPEEVMRRAAAARIKSIPTGVEHGTVTLVVEGRPFEVTTLREDIETFGRKARVAFGRDWARDAERRDFTINGLSVESDGTVHDHVGGLDDIAAKRVRFIGDPDRRIAEDYLRILRFFRIHAAYGGGEPDRDSHLACIRGRAGLTTLSAERMRAEILKLLVAEGAVEALVAMEDGGLLLTILGGVAYRGPLAAMIVAERALELAPDPIRRLAALAVSVTEDARRVAQRLRLSNAEAKQLELDGPSVVAAGQHGRGNRAAANLPAWGAALPRSADAGLVAGWPRRRSGAVAKRRNPATALAAAGLPFEGRGFRRTRNRGRSGARTRSRDRGRCLACRGFPARFRATFGDCRSDRRAVHARSPAVRAAIFR